MSGHGCGRTTGFSLKRDADNRGRTPPPDANAKRWGKEGARAMKSIKEKLKDHAEIERKNRENVEAWKRGKEGAAK